MPLLIKITPGSVRAGYPNFKLVVEGQGFVSGAQLFWNGAPRPTTLVSYNRVIALIYAADVASPGSASLTVDNGAPGTLSNALSFAITAATGRVDLRLSGVSGLTRTSAIRATATIANNGTATASDVKITAARMKGAGTGTTLPLSLGNLGPGGGNASVVLAFPLNAGGPGVEAMLEVSGTYSGGTFKLSRRVVLP